MEINTLKLFFEVARRGNFATVARDRAVDPSSISRVIAGLEDELGFRLFQRTTRRMKLTEAGASYARRVEALIDELEHAGDEALALRTGLKGTLRLTASVAFGQHCLVPLIGDFRARYPDLKLEFLFTDARLDMIDNRVDLAVRLGPVAEVENIQVKLFDARFKVCASPGYIAAQGPVENPEQLTDRRCLRFDLPDFRTHWRFRKGDAPSFELPVDGDILISSAIALRDAALFGLGPALLAEWMIRRDLAEGRLIDLLPDYIAGPATPETAVWLLYPSRTFLPNKVRVMIDFLKSRLGNSDERHALIGTSGSKPALRSV
ncbi:MAG: LysR substrate-binding domain-containing protein [Hyphomicrobiales bacterium]